MIIDAHHYKFYRDLATSCEPQLLSAMWVGMWSSQQYVFIYFYTTLVLIFIDILEKIRKGLLW